MKKVNLNAKATKILVAMYNLIKDSSSKIKFEDLVVKFFELFPETFKLEGYNQYPDSHKINRSIYTNLKPSGYIKTYGNGFYKLTPTGYNLAKLFNDNKNDIEDISVSFNKEKNIIIKRLFNSEAFELFKKNKLDSIVDNDFLNFYRVSVRMKKNDFINNIELIKKIILEAKEIGIEESSTLLELNNFLLSKYSKLIEKMVEKNENKN
jgi:hypothetical protein